MRFLTALYFWRVSGYEMIEQVANIKLDADGGGAFGGAGFAEPDFGLARSGLLTLSGDLKPAVSELLRCYEIDINQEPQDLLASMKSLWWGEGQGLLLHLREEFARPPVGAKYELCKAAGYAEPVTAPALPYSHALFMGGPLPWVRDRLTHLVDQWNEGVRFEKLVLLGADRPLSLQHGESLAHLKTHDPGTTPFKAEWQFNDDSPLKDEMDMMERVFEQSAYPTEWGNSVPIIKVKSFAKNGRNANTEQTVVDFLDQHPEEGFSNVLTASSQPFVHYQNLVTAAVFKEKGITVDNFLGIGAGRFAGPRSTTPEYAYFDQLIRRFAYELRYREA